MTVPPGVKPAFVRTSDQISPTEINEKFQNGPSYGLAAVQFLAALNVYFGGNKELSRNVMSEFFHNLSLQALTVDDDRIEITLDEIIELNRNLKCLIRDDDKNEIQIVEQKKEEYQEIKDKTQLIEEEVVSNSLNDVRVEFPTDNQNSFPNTSAEILKETNETDKINQGAAKAFNERDVEISYKQLEGFRQELIKSVTDSEREIPTDVLNNIATTYQLEIEGKEKKDVRKHVENTIKKDNKQYLEKLRSSSKIPRAI